MTNIIVGNMVVGFLTVVIGNVSYAFIHNETVLRCVLVIMSISATAVYYFIGEYSYHVKIWQVIVIGAVNTVVFLASSLCELKMMVLLTMGPQGIIGSAMAETAGKTEAVYIFAEIVRVAVYALICLGIMVGRRKNREQYEVFLEIEKEQKERRKAYKEQRRKRDNGEL